MGRHKRKDARIEARRAAVEQEARERFPGCDSYAGRAYAETFYCEITKGKRTYAYPQGGSWT